MQTTSEPVGRIGLPTILGAIFITLKLTGVINWSWWWVLSPFWISFGLVVVFLTLFVLVEVLT